MAEKKSLKIVIDQTGDYTLEALEGFSGTSCVEETRELELMLANGASVTDEGKKPEYYEGDAFTHIESKL